MEVRLIEVEMEGRQGREQMERQEEVESRLKKGGGRLRQIEDDG